MSCSIDDSLKGIKDYCYVTIIQFRYRKVKGFFHKNSPLGFPRGHDRFLANSRVVMEKETEFAAIKCTELDSDTLSIPQDTFFPNTLPLF